MLFMEAMDDNEAIWIQGFETFSKTSGYARTLQFAGNNQDLAQVGRCQDQSGFLLLHAELFSRNINTVKSLI